MKPSSVMLRMTLLPQGEKGSLVTPALNKLDTDILILGAGGAGLFAALHAKKAAPDLDVTIAVKGLLGKCGCTRMVQAATMSRWPAATRSNAISWTRSKAANG